MFTFYVDSDCGRIVDTKNPEPDSQYRLRPCFCCGGHNVSYVKIICGDRKERWKVECQDCAHKTTFYYDALHDAQTAWNHIGEVGT